MQNTLLLLDKLTYQNQQNTNLEFFQRQSRQCIRKRSGKRFMGRRYKNGGKSAEPDSGSDALFLP